MANAGLWAAESQQIHGMLVFPGRYLYFETLTRNLSYKAKLNKRAHYDKEGGEASGWRLDIATQNQMEVTHFSNFMTL